MEKNPQRLPPLFSTHSTSVCRTVKGSKKKPISSEDADRLLNLLVEAANEHDDAQVQCSIAEHYFYERVLSAARSIAGMV